MRELLTDCDWVNLHIDALYRSDESGRLQARRAAADGPAPRFFFARTAHGTLWRFRGDLPASLARRLSRLAGREPPLAAPPAAAPAVPAPPERLAAMAEALEAAAPIERRWRGPLYRVRLSQAERARLGRQAAGARRVECGEPQLQAALRDLAGPALDPRMAAPLFGAFQGAQLQALAWTAAGDAARVAEAGVVTLPEARGRGHAAACVAAWALDVLEAGGQPLYSTQWTHVASRRVAEKLALELYGESIWIE